MTTLHDCSQGILPGLDLMGCNVLLVYMTYQHHQLWDTTVGCMPCGASSTARYESLYHNPACKRKAQAHVHKCWL